MLKFLWRSIQISLGEFSGTWLKFDEAMDLCHYQTETGQLLYNGDKKEHVSETQNIPYGVS